MKVKGASDAQNPNRIWTGEEQADGTVLRGLFFGVFWGTAFGVVIVGLLSLISEVPGQRAPTPIIEAPRIEVLPPILSEESGVQNSTLSEPRPSGQTMRRVVPESSAPPTLGQEVTSPGQRPSPVQQPAVLPQTFAPVASEASLPRVAAGQAPAAVPGLELPKAPDVSGFRLELDTSPSLPPSAPGTVTTIITVPQAAVLPPLTAYAVPSSVDPAKPLMSIVVLDDPTGRLGPAALGIVPFPVTVAVSGTDPRAADRMAAYRRAGFEVVLNAELPASASQSDIETAFDYFFDAVPQTVAVLLSSDAKIEQQRQNFDAVTEILAGTGHGLIHFADEDPQDALPAARPGTVPVAEIALDLDGKSQSTSVVRRFLDQSAFRARQDGTMVVLARLRPETITAFQIWAQRSRALSLNLVPVSAILNP